MRLNGIPVLLEARRLTSSHKSRGNMQLSTTTMARRVTRSSSTFPPPRRVHKSTVNNHEEGATTPIDAKVDGGPALLLRRGREKKDVNWSPCSAGKCGSATPLCAVSKHPLMRAGSATSVRDRVLLRPWQPSARVEHVDGSSSVLDKPMSDVLTLQFLGPAQPGVRQHGHP